MEKLIQSSNDVGTFLKEAREKLGKEGQLERVSYLSGFSVQTISNIENNRSSANVSTLIAVAQVIGVKIKLISDKPKDKKETTI